MKEVSMRRFLFPSVFALSAALGAVALAQEDLSARLRPITAPIRHAGVYHVATGTWTRGASLDSAVGPSVIYDNTCAPVYWASQSHTGATTDRFQHRSRVPSPSGPSTPSIYYATGYDELPGCATSYVVDGFQIAYCSSATHVFDYRIEFANNYTACGAAAMVADEVFDLTALPGGSPAGAQQCWVVDVDLQGSGQTFVLSADGDGTYTGPSTSEQFGCAWTMIDPTIGPADFTGPIIAGDFTWTGGPGTGPLTPCRGTDGTIFESPAEPGTGMASNDFFRFDPQTVGPGCYYFGGNPHADFYLKLFSEPPCPPPDALVEFCFPGADGVRTCPCGNPPASSTVGCDNFGPNPPGGTGGARLDATGWSRLGRDTLEFQVTGEIANAGNVTVLWQGTRVLANGSPSGLRFGAGVRCVGGTLKRIYEGDAIGGSIVFPSGSQPDVHTASAAKGYTIVPPISLHYFAAYRNSAAGTPCGNASLGYNATNAGSVAWTP
jgi:hypothetical protein